MSEASFSKTANRSVLGVMNRLEFEMDELRGATSISRTSSGLAIAENPSPHLDIQAVLALVDRIVAGGYLNVKTDRFAQD